MHARQAALGHEDRERIFEYVQRHGAATRDELAAALRVDPAGLRHHLAILRRDGVLTREDDGDDPLFRVAVEDGETEEHTDSGLEFAIRPARQSDLSGLVGAIRQVASDGTLITAESVADQVDHENVLLRHDAVEHRMFFVATVDGEVVGWVHLRGPELAKLGHTAELTLGVLEEYRGHGVGSHLLERGLQWAAGEGYEKIYESVPASNEGAVEFLEGHGWSVEAVREGHYRIDGEYVDEVMLAVEL